MRKFTLFLALMVAMVTTAFAQGSEVIDLASNADAMLYSNAPCKVTTWGDDFKGWHVLFDDDASTFFHSDYSDDDTVDGLDHYLRVDMGEGNSVSLFTFTFTTRNTNSEVNSPTTIVVEGSNEAEGEYTEIATLSGLPTTNSTVYTSDVLGSEDVAYRYIRYRVTATKTNQTKGGHVFFFIAEFGMTKISADANPANIKYTYTYNGNTIGSATYNAFVGDAYPEPTNLPFGYFAETPDGTIEGDEELSIECTLKMPFEYAETADAIKTWYYIQMHSNNKRYIQYVEGENSIEWADAEVAEGEENSYIWAFVGTPANGFKLVNYAAKVEMALCGNGEGNPAMGAYADGINWVPAASDVTGKLYFCLQYPGGEYLNAQNDKIAYWTDNDAGSTFMLTVAEPVVEPENGIDTSKEYYLYSSYNWGMNQGYLTIGTKSGSNYGQVYMANEKLQAFKLTPAADGGYTLSREVDMSGMSYTEYIDCTHSCNVGSNAMSGSTLYFELNANNKYNIRSANGYFKADMITYETGSHAYHVFSNGDMTSALEWELIPVEDVVDPEQPAAEPLNYVSHSPATVVESVSEVTITFDREVGSVSSDLSNVKLKLGTNVPARGMNSVINGNSVTIYLTANVKSSGEYTLEIPADIIKAADGGAFAGTTLTIIVDAAPTMTSKSSVTVDNTLSDIAVEFDSEIEFATGAEKLQLVVKGTETVAAEFVVGESAIIEGNVLTLTLAEEIAPEATTKYDLAIPADFIVKKGSDKAFAGKTITYTVKVPFVVKNITPASGSIVEVLENIVIEFNESVFDYKLNTLKLVNIADNSEVALTGVANGNILTLTPNDVVANGTYSLVNINNIVNNSYSPVAEAPEYTITVAASVVEPDAEPLVPTSVTRTSSYIEYQLKGVQVMFDEKVTATAPENGEYGYVLNAAGEKVFTFDKMSGGTGIGKFATFSNSDYSAVIETAGEYKVVITTVITGESGKVYNGGEYAFTVTKHPVEVERSVEFWGTVEELPLNISITINYADAIELDATKKVTYVTGETTYEAVVTKEENVINIAFDENVEYPEGDYTFNVPAGLYTADGEANEEIAEEFTYKKPVPLKVLNVQPAEGKVESISTITITFNQAIEPNYMFEMGNRLFIRSNGWEASAVVEYTACDGNGEPSPITEAGEYVFDMSFVTDFLAEGEKTTYTWTIEATGTTAIEGVDAEVENDVIYDLTGRRIVEITKAGVYVVNGKKVIVK